MAAGMRKFRVLILLLAFCSTVYIAIGPGALNFWNGQETRSEGKVERDGQVTRAEPVRKTFVGKVFNTSKQALKRTQRKPYPIQQLPVPGRPRLNLNVQPAIADETVIEDDNDRVNDGLIYDCFDDERDIVESRQSVNGKPVYGKNRTVMFVSMPNCGSRTFIWTSVRLRQVHHFGKQVNFEYMLNDNPALKIRNLMDTTLQKAEKGAIIHGHYRYIDMYGSPKKPILMSMIRDPVDRFESHFYFMRNGDQDTSKEFVLKKLSPRMALPNETLDDCIEKDRRDCTSSLLRNMYVTSFCGYDPRCSEYPSFALEEAKRNVDKFLVIGVMEEYDLSMAVFAKLLPETFGGAAKIYEENKEHSMEKSKTNYKKLPSPKTYSILKQRMKYDYAFYDYVKKRLHKVAKKLRIGNCSGS